MHRGHRGGIFLNKRERRKRRLVGILLGFLVQVIERDWGIWMGRISLRLPDGLHVQARKLAEQESVSVNQLVTLALAEKLSALMTEDYLEARAKRGSRKKFVRAMGKVSKAAPEALDRLAG